MKKQVTKTQNNPKRTNWYKGGIAVECTYKDGRLEGSYKAYHRNGQLAWQASYKNGLLQGTASEWDEDGNLICRSNYKNGVVLDSDIKFYKRKRKQSKS